MKNIVASLFCAGCLILNSPGEDVEASQIKEMVKKMDDSLVEGHIYHLRYTVDEKNTDSFYNHKKELIKLLQDVMAKDQANPASNSQLTEFSDKQNSRLEMIKSMQHDLVQVRDRNYSCDYSVDGVGFYMKIVLSHVSPEGKAGLPVTTTYVSDGKIKGTFYKNDSQGVIEPATERPSVPFQFWTDIAYHFTHDSLTSCVSVMPKLSLTEDAGQLVISGERTFDAKSKVEQELRFDKATLTPVKATLLFYNYFGNLHSQDVKTWQYQEFGGVRLPKLVIDQHSETDLSGKLNLEKERVFTILDFSPTPTDCKNAFAELLKANFSMYDEITGAHYLSGNPAQALDNLSK